MQSKKGESLVEVVVSLGIMTFVFMGVVNIVLGAVTLNLTSRQRIQTIATTEKNLNIWLAENRPDNSCPLTARPLVVPPPATRYIAETPTGCAAITLSSTTSPTCYWLELTDINDSTEANLGQTTANFIKISSHGKWYTRIIGESSFEISQVIRKN